MIEKMFICTLLLLVFVIQQQNFGSAQTASEEAELLENYRGFQTFLDQEKLTSYLSSFGGQQTTKSEDHEIFKRSTNEKRRRKSGKKATTTTTAPPPASIEEDDAEIITGKPKKIYDDDELESIDKFQQRNQKQAKVNFQRPAAEKINPSPRQVFRFEIDDAVYSEEYEKFRKAKNNNGGGLNRKLRSPSRPHHSRRAKRSSPADNDDDKKVTATGVKTEPQLNNAKDAFRQPREFLKFLISDAVTKAPAATGDVKESSEKRKRETDMMNAETIKNVALANSASQTSSSVAQQQNQQQSPREPRHITKHVGFDDMSPKLKGMIESALVDAITRKNANENDYLKFFYGDKIIKVPMSLSKHIKLNFHKDSSPSKVEQSSKTQHSSKPSTYYKYEKPIYHTTAHTPTKQHHYNSGKAESFANFKSTPIIVGKPIENIDIPKLEAPATLFDSHNKKSLYFFTSEHDTAPSPPSSLFTPAASPEPIIYSTPSSVESSYKSHVDFPTHTEVKFLKDSIPITEHIDESYSGYHPPALPSTVSSPHQVQQLHHAPHAAAAPAPQHSSFVDYGGNYDGYDKNYEFGYHISDYKTGNSYGHQQQKHEKETKGEYSILLPDGRIQIVRYVANDSGFHADVSYETVHHKK